MSSSQKAFLANPNNKADIEALKGWRFVLFFYLTLEKVNGKGFF